MCNLNKSASTILSLIFIVITGSCYCQTIKGRLLYKNPLSGKSVMVPAKRIAVILIPTQNTNARQVKNYQCDNAELKKMSASLTTTDEMGYYYFTNLKKGHYTIKVCLKNGVVYKFGIPQDNFNIMLIPDMLATND